jgi:hypothetical protein
VDLAGLLVALDSTTIDLFMRHAEEGELNT